MLRLRRTPFAAVLATLTAIIGFAVATPTSAASTVSGIRVTDAQPTAMTINWHPFTGAVKYRVYVSPTESMPGSCEPHCSVVTPRDASSPSHRLTGLKNGATYWIKISAINASGRTMSGWQTTAHQVELPAKATVAGVSSADAQPTAVTLRWTKFDGAEKYRVYISPTEDMPGRCEPHCQVITPASLNSPSFTPTGLNRASDYWVKISAINASGHTISSWQPDPYPVTLPSRGTVSGVSVSDAQTNSMVINWDSYPDAEKYRVYVSPTESMPSSCEPHCTIVTPADRAQPSHKVSGLIPGQSYWIKISAINASGRTLTGWQATATKATLPDKGVVTGIAANPATTSLTLTWNAYPQGQKYRIYVSPTSTMPSRCEPHCTVVTPTDASRPSYKITGLEPGSSQWIKISAINASGRTVSDWQSTAVQTRLDQKGVVAGISAEPSTTSTTLSWNAYPDAAKYRVYVSPTADMPGACEPHCQVITPADLASPRYTVTGLKPGSSHWIKISALDSDGRTITNWPTTAVKTILLTNDAKLTVASFNVKCFSCLTMPESARPALELPWVDRRALVAKTIVSRQPDVIGIQEASQAWIYENGKQLNRSQFEDLLMQMKLVKGGESYALSNTHRNNCVRSTTPTSCSYKDQGASKGTKIFYNTATTTLLSSGSYRLQSAGPNQNERYLAWAIVQDKESGQKYFFGDTHLEPGRQFDAVRKVQAEQLAAEIKRRNPDNLPVVLVGDFNSTRYFEPSNAPYDTFIAAGLVDPLGHTYMSPRISSKATAEKRINAHYNSFGNFSPIQRRYAVFENGSNLDYILTSPMRTLEWETVVNIGPNGDVLAPIPSDHNMLVAKLLLSTQD